MNDLFVFPYFGDNANLVHANDWYANIRLTSAQLCSVIVHYGLLRKIYFMSPYIFFRLAVEDNIHLIEVTGSCTNVPLLGTVSKIVISGVLHNNYNAVFVREGLHTTFRMYSYPSMLVVENIFPTRLITFQTESLRYRIMWIDSSVYVCFAVFFFFFLS